MEQQKIYYVYAKANCIPEIKEDLLVATCYSTKELTYFLNNNKTGTFLDWLSQDDFYTKAETINIEE